ncbi:thiol-disulfide oxidoreductase DCC family protein [Prosthecobacter sp.]|uniref:thiol-disulfide oxidoreductase DCC family protein n=1 Tax=Prosthecobacter sp. TaxID=1965333 RepID=UPI0024886649|nr:thiol-disulfide oxidoreductase DCC family protein [Prosthecobacter sp.]MDI1311204.1 thiol-disulfide oxidoreductase DCC family protein [Prosthecobacter sp.]
MPHYDPICNHLLLFDGVCHLCNGSVQFILKRDPQGKIKFAPIQSPLGSQLYTQHGLDPAAPNAMLFLTPRGAFQASDAALEIARTLGGVWKLALIFKPLPRVLRDAAYYFIARNRYRWFGKDESCMMPTPELKARMLE